MKKITEQPSHYRNLEQQSTRDILTSINTEDEKVPSIVKEQIPAIQKLVDEIVDKMLSGGRLFYIGAGTSGRLGILDASECPPTFGVEHGLVVGLMAGGDQAIRKAAEFAEDDPERGWRDLQYYSVNKADVVIGLAASGTTPYVVGGIERCNKNGIITGAVTCNPDTPLAQAAHHSIEIVVGPELITGSTRMKAGTAQKLTLNMISTAVMIRLGRVEDNRMVHMQLTNEKLLDRGTRLVAERLNITYDEARERLNKTGSVDRTITAYK